MCALLVFRPLDTLETHIKVTNKAVEPVGVRVDHLEATVPPQRICIWMTDVTDESNVEVNSLYSVARPSPKDARAFSTPDSQALSYWMLHQQP